MGEMLAKVIISNHNTWQDYLTQVQFAYNTEHHESIADIPYRVVFKEIPRTLLQVAADSVCRPTGHTVTSPAGCGQKFGRRPRSLSESTDQF